MKKYYLSAIVAVLIAFSGCSSFLPAPKYPGDSNKELNQYKIYWDNSSNSPIAQYNAKASAGTATKPDLKAIVYGRLDAIDINYRRYRNDLYSESKEINFGSQALVLTLSALGTVGGPTFNSNSLKIFSASSGLAAGVDGAFNKEFFYSQTLPLIITTMDQARLVVRRKINQEFSADAVPDLHEMLNYVEAYYNAGSMITAVNVLTSTVIASAATPTQTAFSVKLTSPTTGTTLEKGKPLTIAAQAELGAQPTDTILSMTVLVDGTPVKTIMGNSTITFDEPTGSLTEDSHSISVLALTVSLQKATDTVSIKINPVGTPGVVAPAKAAPAAGPPKVGNDQKSQSTKSTEGALGIPL